MPIDTYHLMCSNINIRNLIVYVSKDTLTYRSDTNYFGTYIYLLFPPNIVAIFFPYN